ncbi:uncharacterized protein [Branchiostoma lanceolatum]|uniref:uncharacterized protein isoform X2 n=1 Tax=Branchiostoma lanceolatum TaxID=7740 RepID=UPI003453DD57
MRMRNSRPNTAGARYSRLPQDDDGFIDLQFERPPRKVPYKAIGLAAVLFLLGSALLTVGALLLAGVYIDPQYADRTWPVLLIILSYPLGWRFAAVRGVHRPPVRGPDLARPADNIILPFRLALCCCPGCTSTPSTRTGPGPSC